MESFAIDEVLDLKLSSLSENDIALIYPVIIDSNADKIISTTPFSNDVIFLHHVEAESPARKELKSILGSYIKRTKALLNNIKKKKFL